MCLRWVVLWRQTSYSASVDVTIFERGCAYCDTGHFLEKSLQRLKKRRPEIKTFLNYIAIKDRSLTSELVSKCDSIELVWSNLGTTKKNKNKKIGRPFSPTAAPGSPQAILTWSSQKPLCSFNTFSMRDSLPPRRSFQNSFERLNNMFMHRWMKSIKSIPRKRVGWKVFLAN